MINEDLDQNICTFQFRASILQAANNNQQFFVINLVIAFCENHVLTIKDYFFEWTEICQTIFEELK